MAEGEENLYHLLLRISAGVLIFFLWSLAKPQGFKPLGEVEMGQSSLQDSGFRGGNRVSSGEESLLNHTVTVTRPFQKALSDYSQHPHLSLFTVFRDIASRISSPLTITDFLNTETYFD